MGVGSRHSETVELMVMLDIIVSRRRGELNNGRSKARKVYTF